MTEKRQPWGKWYWGDWRKDARLRRCSYAARGLWADMLSLMGGECDRYGVLVMEGQVLGADDLAGLLGGSVREIERMLAELEGKRVFNRVGDAETPADVQELLRDAIEGAIISRRMIRDAGKSEEGRRHIGKRWANRSDGENNDGPNRSPNTQKLEARSQKPEKKESPPDGFDRFWAAYPNRTAKGHAIKAFAKAVKAGASPSDIIAGAERYRDDPKRNPDFTKHPATWLNGLCWQDASPAPLLVGAGPSDEDWRAPERRRLMNRILAFRGQGEWHPFYGPKPGEPGCDWPDWLQREELDRAKSRAA